MSRYVIASYDNYDVIYLKNNRVLINNDEINEEDIDPEALIAMEVAARRTFNYIASI